MHEGKNKDVFQSHKGIKCLHFFLFMAGLLVLLYTFSAHAKENIMTLPDAQQITQSLEHYFDSKYSMIPSDANLRKITVIAEPVGVVNTGEQACIFSYVGYVIKKTDGKTESKENKGFGPYETYVFTDEDGQQQIISAPLLPPNDGQHPAFKTAGTEWDSPLKAILVEVLTKQQYQEALQFLKVNNDALTTALDEVQEYREKEQLGFEKKLEEEKDRKDDLSHQSDNSVSARWSLQSL